MLIAPAVLVDLQEALLDTRHDVIRVRDPITEASDVIEVVAEAGRSTAVDVVGVGEAATAVWTALASGRLRSRSLVMLSVPGVKNLDFNKGPRVPVLALHSQRDHHVMTTHAFVHRALAFGQQPHQMIEYDRVRARFWDRSSSEWDRSTALDAFDRAAGWGTSSVGYRVRSQESA